MPLNLNDDDDRRQSGRRFMDEPLSDWRPTVLNAIGLVLFAVLGWIATTTTSNLNEMQKQLNVNAQETAVLRENSRNMREQLDRMEATLNMVRSQQQERRR